MRDSVRSKLFLQPVQLHFHLPDLLVKLGQQLLLDPFFFRHPSIREQLLGRLQQLLLPLGDLAGMNPMSSPASLETLR